ncbi:MAG: hypothetical protein Q4A40_02950 [Bacillota bacterium]|nr:hypothetical protein [Bacillota bacterium]
MNKDEMQRVLLREIDTICRENGLTYILYGYSLKALNMTGRIVGFDHPVSIAMVQGEAEKLFEILLQNENKDRFVQYSSEKDTSFLFWGGNYGWNETSCFNVNADIDGCYRGICVHVEYIETIPNDNVETNLQKRYLRLRKLKEAAGGSSTLVGKYSMKTKIAKSFQSRKKLTRKYYLEKSKHKIECWDDLKKLEKVMIGGNTVWTNSITEPEYADVEGTSIMVPNDIGLFLACLFLPRIVTLKRRGRIIDEVLDCKEVIDVLKRKGILDQAVEYQKDINRIRSEVKAEREKIAQLEKIVNGLIISEGD